MGNNIENKCIALNEFKSEYKKNSLRKIPIIDKNYDYLTTDECAKRLHITSKAVSALCRGGYFEGAFKIGTSWRIPERKREEQISST